jgi:hypothetical protein
MLYEEIALGTVIPDADASGFAEWRPSSRIRAMLGVGPYSNFELGQEIRIVIVAAIGGAATKMTEELGRQEFKGLVTKEERLRILATGGDSLLQNITRAQLAFRRNYQLPDPPPPPPTLAVVAQGGHVALAWSDAPRATPDLDTGADDFAGYSIYRSVGNPDGPFTLAKVITRAQLESGEETTDYKDFDVARGVAYYYRVTAFDDGNQNWLRPGQPLESITTAGNTARGVSAFSEPIHTADQLKMVRVIPNPYNLFGVLNFPGPPLQRNKLLFSNLPPVCTIRIYTVSGDLVETIEHTDGSGDEEWDQISRSNQFVLSGIYIAHIESDLGNQIVKFVIVR